MGGILVLFIYITRIASNEKFKFSNKITLFLRIYICLCITTLFRDNFIFIINSLIYDIETQYSHNINLSINKFINLPIALLIIILIIYLLVTLIAIVKISDWKKGTLRSNI